MVHGAAQPHQPTLPPWCAVPAASSRFLPWLRSLFHPRLAHLPGVDGDEALDMEPTYEEVLTQGRLQGLPTYRLEKHPR